jgi:hypothetical protein
MPKGRPKKENKEVITKKQINDILGVLEIKPPTFRQRCLEFDKAVTNIIKGEGLYGAYESPLRFIIFKGNVNNVVLRISDDKTVPDEWNDIKIKRMLEKCLPENIFKK